MTKSLFTTSNHPYHTSMILFGAQFSTSRKTEEQWLSSLLPNNMPNIPDFSYGGSCFVCHPYSLPYPIKWPTTAVHYKNCIASMVFLVSWIKSNLISSWMTLKWDIVQCLLTHPFLLPTKWGGKQNYSGNVKGQEALMVYICSNSGLLALGFMSNWEENNCCYKLSKFSKWLPFSLKISPSTIWKQFYEFALLVTTVISFSAWDESHDSTAKSSRLEHM